MNIETVVQPYTFMNVNQIRLQIDLARRVNDLGIVGDMVECGVCNGGSAAILAHFAAQRDRRVWLFDSFEGLPMTTEEDKGTGPDGEIPDEFVAGAKFGYQCVGSLNRVKEVLKLVGANMDKVEIVKGWYHETFPAVSIPQIAMLNLDSDWYASEKLCLNKFYDSVTLGGFVYFDDYYYWPGCRKAAEEFFAEKKIAPVLNRLGNSVWVQKQ